MLTLCFARARLDYMVARERDELDLGLLAQLAGVPGVCVDLVEAPGEHAHDDAIGGLQVREGEPECRPHGLLVRAEAAGPEF